MLDIAYAYDANGLRISKNAGTVEHKYFYVRDIPLNIVGLKDVLGNLVGRYNYDAWGNILSVMGSLASTLGQVNPFRRQGLLFR